MKCPNCGSENVNVQVVTEVKEKKKKGILYWIFVGWWWEPIAWLFLTLPKLIIAIFSKKTKVVTTNHKEAVCQDCGHSWTIK